mmetsp:Transcript_19617/g.40692  ORF Transcript_19617/g.40692 Transcript_19617/m.40692 type:complete len:145 (-) Transcript_19617:1302-1736(-)
MSLLVKQPPVAKMGERKSLSISMVKERRCWKPKAPIRQQDGDWEEKQKQTREKSQPLWRVELRQNLPSRCGYNLMTSSWIRFLQNTLFPKWRTSCFIGDEGSLLRILQNTVHWNSFDPFQVDVVTDNFFLARVDDLTVYLFFLI